MPRKFFKSISPSTDTIRDSYLTRIFGDVLHSSWLWHLHRHTVSTAFFIGIFCAFLPIPGQMLLAGSLAILFRCHLPITVALVWITNPITMTIIYYSNYRLGCFLLSQPALLIDKSFSWASLIDNLALIWQPLLLGSVVAGVFFGSLSYGVVRLSWRLLVLKRWFDRRERRVKPTN